MPKKLTPFERRKMLEARDRGLTEAELKSQFGITDDRTIRHNLKLAEQEQEARLVKAEIIKDALSSHLAEIRALVAQWREAVVIPPPHEVYPGMLSPTYQVERNPLFDSLRQHLPFPTLWRDYSIFANKMDEYLEGCKKLTEEIRQQVEKWDGVQEVFGLNVSLPILKRLGAKAQGKEPNKLRVDKSPQLNSDREFLLVDYQNVLLARDALTYKQRYEKLTAAILASDLAATLVALFGRLTAIEPRIKEFLQEILLRRDYIMYSCALCPGQPRLSR